MSKRVDTTVHLELVVSSGSGYHVPSYTLVAGKCWDVGAVVVTWADVRRVSNLSTVRIGYSSSQVKFNH